MGAPGQQASKRVSYATIRLPGLGWLFRAEKSLSRLCPAQISFHSNFTFSNPQSSEQKLPEAPSLFDLPEHRLYRPHPQGVTLPTPLGSQLPSHPVRRRQMPGNTTSRCRRYHRSMPGLIRWDEGVYS